MIGKTDQDLLTITISTSCTFYMISSGYPVPVIGLWLFLAFTLLIKELNGNETDKNKIERKWNKLLNIFIFTMLNTQYSTQRNYSVYIWVLYDIHYTYGIRYILYCIHP